jgi:hypothetical protein
LARLVQFPEDHARRGPPQLFDTALDFSLAQSEFEAICEIDLTELNSVDPPRGFGRDS